MLKKTYTITEAIPILGVGRTTITYWINIGIIEAEKVGGRWIIDGETMQEWKDFQKSGLSAASEEFRKRFDISLEKGKTIMKSRF